jgi:hypothetical protein
LKKIGEAGFTCLSIFRRRDQIGKEGIMKKQKAQGEYEQKTRK